MPSEYQLHFIRENGDIGLTLFHDAGSDLEAGAQADLCLARQGGFLAVDVHQGARLVTRRRRFLAPAGTV